MKTRIAEDPADDNPASPRGGGRVEQVGFRRRCAMVLQHKWIRIVIFCLACFFTSALYYGWQQYQKMLLVDGAYAWQCTKPSDYDENGECPPQNQSVSQLYSIAAGCEYASAALGGALLDHVGPRRTALIGEIMWGIGTLMLALSSHSLQLYVPAMIVIGSSVNTVCFPSLTTLETFPKWKGLLVAVMLGSETAATGVPPVLYYIQTAYKVSLRNIWLGYLGFIWAPMTLFYLIALPSANDFESMLRVQRTQLLELEKARAQIERHGASADLEPGHALADGDADAESTDVSSEERNGEIIQQKASWRQFFRAIFTIDMLVMAIYFCILMLMYAYYPTVVRLAISDKISDFLAYTQPAQAIAGLLVGFLCDWYSTVSVMLGMNLCLQFTLISWLFPSVTWLQYLSSIIFNFSQAAVFEVKFTYVAEMFDPYNFGKLVGYLGIVGGIGTFINIPVGYVDSYRAVFIAYCILNPIILALALFLGWRQRQGVSYKTLPELRQKTPPTVGVASVISVAEMPTKKSGSHRGEDRA